MCLEVGAARYKVLRAQHLSAPSQELTLNSDFCVSLKSMTTGQILGDEQSENQELSELTSCEGSHFTDEGTEA